MHTHEVVTLCLIVVAGFACQWIAWKTRIPAILYLLMVGIAAGPVLDVVDPDALFGDLLVPLVSIGVAIILFEGALTLKVSNIRGRGAVVRNLVTLGVLITWSVSGICAFYLLDWDPYLAMLFGAIVTVSGPTVVTPLLRAVRPKAAVAEVLRWEAILIDPIGAILALLVFDFILASQTAEGIGDVARSLGVIAAVGGALGLLGGRALGSALLNRRIPDFLRDYAALGFVLAVFAASEYVHSESGLLAVTIMGIWLANREDVDLDDIVSFKESLTLLLVAGLFIVLAARVNLEALSSLGISAVMLVLALQLIAGPLRAFACSFNSDLNWREKLFLGLTFPRGIIAAAISAIFALRLEEDGHLASENLVPVVFSVILGTVLLQSLASRPMARWLEVVEPDPRGILIVGSNPVAVAIAAELRNAGQRVLIADSDWDGIQSARMLGIPTFYGSPVSAYSDLNLEITGLGYLLALSSRPGLNELACAKFAAEFGRDNVFTLSNQTSGEHEKHRVSGERIGRVLFGGAVTLVDLKSKLAKGAVVKSTVLSSEFGWREYRNEHAERQVLFGRDEGGRLHFPTADQEFEPRSEWTVFALANRSNRAESDSKRSVWA